MSRFPSGRRTASGRSASRAPGASKVTVTGPVRASGHGIQDRMRLPHSRRPGTRGAAERPPGTGRGRGPDLHGPGTRRKPPGPFRPDAVTSSGSWSGKARCPPAKHPTRWRNALRHRRHLLRVAADRLAHAARQEEPVACVVAPEMTNGQGWPDQPPLGFGSRHSIGLPPAEVGSLGRAPAAPFGGPDLRHRPGKTVEIGRKVVRSGESCEGLF